MKNECLLEIKRTERIIERQNNGSANRCVKKLIYMLFENRIDLEDRAIKTYGICACSEDKNGETDGCIMCDVSSFLPYVKVIFERMQSEAVFPENMKLYVEKMLDEISEEILR